jgi:hypothetical protein
MSQVTSMTEGVNLRCINAPYKQTGRGQYLVAGKYYEIAEIMEMPGHAMARKPDGKWPKPGDPYFAFHADDCFSVPKDGIPAFSCGYMCVDEQFFGTIIPNSLFPTPPQYDFPKISRQQSYVSNIVDRAGVPGLYHLTYHNVLPKVCFPESLEKEFMFLGIEYRDMHAKVTAKTVSLALKSVMRKLGIPSNQMPPVEDQLVEFWHPSCRKAGPWKWKTPTKWPK